MTDSSGSAARPADVQPATEAGKAASDEPVRRARSGSSDMVRSLLVILAVIGVLLLIVPRPNKLSTESVDVVQAAASAHGQLGFEPAVPKALPDGWTAVAASVQQATGRIPTWHLSYLTPSGRYAGIQQAAHPTQAWENHQVTDGSSRQGEHQAAGRTWLVRSRTDRGITSWVLREPEQTIVLTGTAGEQELDQLASALFG